MALASVAPTLASQDREKENRGLGISDEVKAELKARQEDRREDRKEDKERLAKMLKFAPRSISFVATLTVAPAVSAFSTSTTSTPITVKVTKVTPKRPKQMTDQSVVYPTVDQSLVLTLTNKTQLVRDWFGRMKLSEMTVGDELRIVAKYNKDGSLIVVSVKDNSLHVLSDRKGVIESINAAAQSFVLKQDKRTLTVNTSAETKFVSKLNPTAATISFADLKVGQTVAVDGLVNTNLQAVAKAKVVTVKKDVVPAPVQ